MKNSFNLVWFGLKCVFRKHAAEQMQCNWLSIVRGDGGLRACVFCGQHKREHCKTISVSSVKKLLAAQGDKCKDDVFSCTMHNICQSAIDSHDVCKIDEAEANFSACLCCHHWVARRKKKKYIFPLQALAYYVHTLRTVEGKNMDHRVVLRLCKALSAKGPAPLGINLQGLVKTHVHTDTESQTSADNHYIYLFKQERFLLEEIACNSIKNIGLRMAQFYHTQNASTIFSQSCYVVEKIRKSQSSQSRLE